MSKSCENSIREAAYYLWQNAGSPAGQDDYFWTLAVEQCGCSKKAKASTSAKSSTKSSAKKSISASVKSASTSAKKTTTTKKY